LKKIFFILFLVGCSQKPSIEEIDGCQYVVIKNQYGAIDCITHKGDCWNTIHQYIDTTDMSEPMPKTLLYARRNNKATRVGVQGMGTTPIAFYCFK